MNLIAWLIIGAVAGWLASVVMKTRASQGIFMDIVFGILGAVVGGFVMSMFGATGITGFNIYSLLVATVGAILLVWIAKMIRTA
jgi:uncharacterized membrane protein YeaQ/YmgE (transglycosylase-associated protein family)